MAKTKPAFYTVWKGRTPGVYTSWDECRKQVEGFPEARFKAFPSETEARKALAGTAAEYFNKRKAIQVPEEKILLVGKPDINSISVDAACSGNPGILEYRGVLTATGEEIFRRGPFPQGTTNIGEFLAIVTGLLWLKQHQSGIPIYSDSRNGIKWVKMKRINTKLERTEQTEALFQVIDKALEWLHNNRYENAVLKWETAIWGEIPADFGRK